MTLILSGTNGLSDIDGSAATPAIRGTDANTGIFFGTDIIGFSEGGVEAMRIDSDGDVGIGTTAPTNKLHVSSSSFETIKLQGTSTVSGINFVNSASSNGYIYYDNGPNMLFYTNGSERMRIDSSGNVLVGATSALGKITSSSNFDPGAGWDTTAALSTTGSYGGGLVMVDGSGGYGLWCEDGGNDFYIRGSNSLSSALTGGVYLNDRATSWSSASDERLKTIIEPITDAVSKVCQLRTVIGRYNYEAEDKRHPFLIAQDVQAVLPEAVSVANKQSEEQYLGVSYTDTIPLLVAAIKEQQALITALTARITALETQNADNPPQGETP